MLGIYAWLTAVGLFAFECGWVLVALCTIIRYHLKDIHHTTKNCSSATRQVQGICIQPIEAELTVS